MCPLRPTAIATPGATASSIAVLTTLSSLPAGEVLDRNGRRRRDGASRRWRSASVERTYQKNGERADSLHSKRGEREGRGVASYLKGDERAEWLAKLHQLCVRVCDLCMPAPNLRSGGNDIGSRPLISRSPSSARAAAR